MELMQYVAGKIKELRENFDSGKGLSQAKLADMLGVATNTISRWETGNYKPSIEDLDKLSRIFNVSVLSFFPDAPTRDDDTVVAFRASDGLTKADIEEIKHYAEFRKARNIYMKKKSK